MDQFVELAIQKYDRMQAEYLERLADLRTMERTVEDLRSRTLHLSQVITAEVKASGNPELQRIWSDRTSVPTAARDDSDQEPLFKTPEENLVARSEPTSRRYNKTEMVLRAIGKLNSEGIHPAPARVRDRLHEIGLKEFGIAYVNNVMSKLHKGGRTVKDEHGGYSLSPIGIAHLSRIEKKIGPNGPQ